MVFQMRTTAAILAKDDLTSAEVAKRRDETIKRMFATPPKKHKDEPRKSNPIKGRTKPAAKS